MLAGMHGTASHDEPQLLHSGVTTQAWLRMQIVACLCFALMLRDFLQRIAYFLRR